MKCINKSKKTTILAVLFLCSFIFSGCASKEETPVKDYEAAHYNVSLEEGSLFSENLCVSAEDVISGTLSGGGSFTSAGLFDLAGKQVLYADSIHEKLYPASVTKIMTALLALENGNLEDQVTISKTAAASSFPSDAQVLGLRQGEVWTLKDLLYALLLYSGNDAATAIAEHISGTEEAFVSMMNTRAAQLMANGTHFTNPHGLHDDEHYTTSYDMYLIFNQCIQDERFVEIISTSSYTATYQAADGSEKETTFEPTNLYAKGTVDQPENITVIGGKTGTTGEAGCCLILLNEDSSGNRYISIVMGEPDKSSLYTDMTDVIEEISGK